MTGRPPLRETRKQRPGTEYLCEYLFRPMAHVVVRVLLPLHVRPPLVVLANAAAGFGAAFQIWHGDLIGGALLLQLKTILDNADGQLARASGRVTAFGRYLDSESDLFVNAAVLLALGHVTGQVWLTLAAFIVLTLVLGIEFNLNRLYREAHGEFDVAPPGTGRPTTALAWLYAVLYGWQDRLVEAFVGRRLAGRDDASRLAYHDPLTVSILANFGLSTQLAALGACLVAGRPAAYFWIVFGCAGVIVLAVVCRQRRSVAPTPVR